MELVHSQDNSPVVLFCSEFPRITKAITIIAGAGILALGTLLGKIKLGAITKAALDENTGDGTLVLDADAPILKGAKAGVYSVRVIRAAIAEMGDPATSPAMKAVAVLQDPDGKILEVFDVATDPGTTVENQVKFVITEGATAFAAGDGFDITIAAGSGKYKAYDDDNVDGSDTAELILAEDVDASGEADVKAVAYVTGHFNTAAVTGLDVPAAEDFAGKGVFFGTVL